MCMYYPLSHSRSLLRYSLSRLPLIGGHLALSIRSWVAPPLLVTTRPGMINNCRNWFKEKNNFNSGTVGLEFEIHYRLKLNTKTSWEKGAEMHLRRPLRHLFLSSSLPSLSILPMIYIHSSQRYISTVVLSQSNFSVLFCNGGILLPF